MLFIPCPNVLQLNLVFSQYGTLAENVLHYDVNGTISVADMLELSSLVGSLWKTHIAPVANPSMVLESVKCTDLTTESSAVTELPGESTWIGEAGGEGLPLQAALVISMKTASRGRSYRGRVYLCGFTESAQANGVWTAGTTTAAANFATAILELTAGAMVVRLSVLSRFHNGAWRTTGVATAVQNFSVDGLVRTQRRRVPGVGA